MRTRSGARNAEQARKRSDIEWVQGDLASVAWKRDFDLIVMTGHAFQVFVEDDLRTALATIRSALTTDGRFIFETRNPLARAWEHWTSDKTHNVTNEAGVMVRMARAVATPVKGDTVSFTHTFSSPNWDRRRSVAAR